MMESSRPARKVAIADHIWSAFEEMAGQMGSDRDALINQAMFMFARLNGFLENQASPGGAAKPVPPMSSNSPVPQRAPAALRPPGPPLLKPSPGPAPAGGLDDDPVRREVANRVLETAAELERLIKGKGPNGAQPEPASNGASLDDLEMDDGSAGSADSPALYMMLEGGELDKIAKDRFVIGRGKHCDFVINSGKVSREHAVLVRDAGEFFIEDLGSSNGTWFNKQRIKRRKIEDGDEYFICSEKVKFVYR
jgi:hypothetical protein